MSFIRIGLKLCLILLWVWGWAIVGIEYLPNHECYEIVAMLTAYIGAIFLAVWIWHTEIKE